MARGLSLALVLGLLLALAPAPSARAQGPAYSPSAPSAGALYRDGQSGRYLLGGAWLYRADPGDQGLVSGWFADLAATDGWTAISVPNAFNAGDFSNASMAGSVGWYRRDFTLPAGAFARTVPRSQRHWIVRFESVNYRATVWLNGVLIGRHTGAYLPFELDLRSLRSGVNRLIVRVDDRHSPGDLPPGPAGGWWNFGGLQREVYVRAVREADIARVQVRTLLPCSHCPATIEVQAVVRNLERRSVPVSLSGHYGSVPLSLGTAVLAPGATWSAGTAIVLHHPHLWSIDHPVLYRATLTLAAAHGVRLGGYVTYSGVRTITVGASGRLALNGRVVHLRGVNLHEQDLRLGAALDPAHLSRLMGWVRALGAHLIRAHYPLDPELEELADRDGVLVWSEIPVYGTSSAYLSRPGWLTEAHRVLAENIRANQNHPSVAVWSIGNELETPAPGAESHYIAGAVALAHHLDPTRPVAMAVSDWPGVPCQSAYAPLDVIGANEYFGWYDAGGGTTDDRDGLSAWLDSVAACYPAKAILVTEFGFEANRSGPVEERGTYAFQADSAAFHLGVFAAKRWLSGALYFALQDFAVTPNWAGGNPWPDPPFLHKGLLDLFGAPKPAFGIVAGIFHATRQIAPAQP
jgi:Glycosyl hydrolases family 2, TIM barrel domain/Glycosyl hydrolases family 2, sugar binding domain/Glycosyl hydrolases family 2